MNEADIIELLGEPDEVLTRGSPRRMVSVAWKCAGCGCDYFFDAPVAIPGPCTCGSIGFLKIKRTIN